MDGRKLALLCAELAEDKKAEDTVVLDVSEVSSITDYFVLASGTSEPHLRAIVSEITKGVEERAELHPKGREGSIQGAWIVLDFFDVIVHLMRPELRELYNLEGLWGDAARVELLPRQSAVTR